MSDGVIPIGGDDEQPIFGDQRREVVSDQPLPVPTVGIPGVEDDDPEAGLPSLRDIKGSRTKRGNPEWAPKGRKPGEDTTGAGAPAPVPGRRSVGAGPGS